MKVFFIIALAHFLIQEQAKQPDPSFKSDLFLTINGADHFVPFHSGLPSARFRNRLVLMAVLGTMLLVAGISWRVIFLLVLSFTSLIIGLVVLYFINFDLFSKVIADHQLERIYGWLDPYASPGDYGYQLMQALMAIGSGHLTGKGFCHWRTSQRIYSGSAHPTLSLP